MAYQTIVDGVDFTFDFVSQLIAVGAATDYLEAATVKEAAREAEASEEGIVYQQIIDASGREVFFEAGGDQIKNALTVVLQGGWLLDTERTTGYFIVSGGNVLQANQDPRIQIFADNPTVNTINNTTQFGTISRVAVGSGVTPEDVTAIGAEVEGRLGPELSDLHRMQGYDPANPATLHRNAQGHVTQIDAGTGHVVDVEVDGTDVTFTRQP